MSWNQSFENKDLPDAVISTLYRNTQDCNFAMCYGIPIVTPSWLQLLEARLKSCWKKSADSQDSFRVPPFDSDDVRPAVDHLLKNRQDPRLWVPDPARRHMWSKWKVLELKKPRGVSSLLRCASNIRLCSTLVIILQWELTSKR